MSKNFDDITIPTYIINLKKRKDRLQSILQEFAGKKEFDINVIAGHEHQNGNVGLWNSIIEIVEYAQANEDEIVILIEDDHIFTENYTKETLFSNIVDASKDGADLLLGGIGGGFDYVVPITENRFWINHFWCTQFVVIYKKFYDVILNVKFSDKDDADHVLSELTLNKMVLYPFISVQKSFGYSDIQNLDENKDSIEIFFKNAENELLFYYSKFKDFSKNSTYPDTL